jgi:hypothetical protein
VLDRNQFIRFLAVMLKYHIVSSFSASSSSHSTTTWVLPDKPKGDLGELLPSPKDEISQIGQGALKSNS